jgi:DNA modification methylase
MIGDVRTRIKEIPDGSVDLVCTSPPFLALRRYGADSENEMGSEATPAEFIDGLLSLTAEFRRVLAPHGSIAVELAVATGCGRDAIGIELYEANAHLIRERVGMFLEELA